MRYFDKSWLLPNDFSLMYNLLKNNKERSQLHGIGNLPKSILYTRFITAPLTIPTAVLGISVYLGRSLYLGSVEVIHGNFREGYAQFSQNGRSSLKCVALTIAAIAYTILGIFAGSKVFAGCAPKDSPKIFVSYEELQKNLNEKEALLKQEKTMAQQEIDRKQADLDVKHLAMKSAQEALKEEQNKCQELEKENVKLQSALKHQDQTQKDLTQKQAKLVAGQKEIQYAQELCKELFNNSIKLEEKNKNLALLAKYYSEELEENIRQQRKGLEKWILEVLEGIIKCSKEDKNYMNPLAGLFNPVHTTENNGNAYVLSDLSENSAELSLDGSNPEEPGWLNYIYSNYRSRSPSHNFE